MGTGKRELEHLWRRRVNNAHQHYLKTSKAFSIAWAEYFDTHLNADGAHALRFAGEAESKALAEYVRVLQIYTDLVVKQKMPPDE